MTEQIVYGPFLNRKQATACGAKHYFTGKPCKSGHISIRYTSIGRCFECNHLANIENTENGYFNKRYHEKLKDSQAKNRANASRYVAANKDDPECVEKKRTQSRNTARRACKDPLMKKRMNEQVKKSNTKYRELSGSKRQAVMARENPSFQIILRLRNRLWDAINEQNADKANSFIELTGCSQEQLVKHIEKQFKQGMSWENYGLDTWHIDHIRPCYSYDLNDIEQQKKCFHYTNLQPLKAFEDLSKG